MVSARLRKKVEHRRYLFDLAELSEGSSIGVLVNPFLYDSVQARKQVALVRELKKEYREFYRQIYDPFPIEP